MVLKHEFRLMLLVFDFNDIDYKDDKIECDYKKIKMDAQRELIETFL